jgi:DNA processing protein
MSKARPQVKDILLLLTIPNFGPGRVRKLLSIFSSTEEIVRAPIQRLIKIDGIDHRLAQLIKSGVNKNEVEKKLLSTAQHQISTLSFWDDNYPSILKKTADPPLVLFYKGIIPYTWPPCIAVVGTRTPSIYGKTAAERLVGELVQNGIAIVSGLARGIDTIAHQTALNQSGQTFAVLGCGLDYIYPPENRHLFDTIPSAGSIFTEYFLGTGPDAVNFPRRNRIISGMSLGTLVIEAGDKSGALITANYAADQNREVFAIPGNINSPKSRGTHRLIQQGAKLVQSVQDILEEIAPGLEALQQKDRPIPPDLPPLEKKLLEKLSHEPRHIDQLVLELNESPAMILAGLLHLELTGWVKQLSGKMFIRI